jgi:uncharacterized membrane protein
VNSESTADKIQQFYEQKDAYSGNRLVVGLSILGALMIGLGIILIVAHNWDAFSREVKTVFAFLPLVLGQVTGGYVLLRRPGSTAWRESIGILMFFAIGACVSLISQIYHIQGDIAGYLLTWMILALPLIYVLGSRMVSMFYLLGSTAYMWYAGYQFSGAHPVNYYWLLLAGGFPFYVYLYRNYRLSNFTVFHNWLLPLSVSLAIGTVMEQSIEFLTMAYVSFFGLIYIVGKLDFFKEQRMRSNGYLVLGSLGTIIMLMILSFVGYWDQLFVQQFEFVELAELPEFYLAIFFTLGAACILVWNYRNQSPLDIEFMEIAFFIFLVTFFIGWGAPVVSAVIINLLVFIIGFAEFYKGATEDHLGILNYGLLIMSALIMCRFFDVEISYVIRGIIFIFVGAAFILVNYWMLQQRRESQ